MSKIVNIQLKAVNSSPWAKYITFEGAKEATQLALADIGASTSALQADQAGIRISSHYGDTGTVHIAFATKTIGGTHIHGDLAGINILGNGEYELVGDFWGWVQGTQLKAQTKAGRFMRCLTTRLIQAGLAGHMHVSIGEITRLIEASGLDMNDQLLPNKLEVAQMLVGAYSISLKQALTVAKTLEINSVAEAELAVKRLEPVTMPLAVSTWVSLDDIRVLARSLGFVVDEEAVCLEPRVAHILPHVNVRGHIRLTINGVSFVVQSNSVQTEQGEAQKYFLVGTQAALDAVKPFITQLTLQSLVVNEMKASVGTTQNVVYKAYRQGPAIAFDYATVDAQDITEYSEGDTNAAMAVARLNAA